MRSFERRLWAAIEQRIEPGVISLARRPEQVCRENLVDLSHRFFDRAEAVQNILDVAKVPPIGGLCGLELRKEFVVRRGIVDVVDGLAEVKRVRGLHDEGQVLLRLNDLILRRMWRRAAVDELLRTADERKYLRQMVGRLRNAMARGPEITRGIIDRVSGRIKGH